MILLTDHDIALKLAQLDLLPLLWEPHDREQSDVIVRANLIEVLQQEAVGKRKNVGVTRLREVFGTFRKLSKSDPHALQLQEAYLKLDGARRPGGFDAGEAQLFLEASKSANAIVQTGDKKALKALHWASSQDEQFLQLSASLKERCLCLEQVLCNGLDEARFDKIQKCDLTVIDSGLASKAMGKSIDAFRNALVTEIRALRSNSGALLRRS